MTDETEKFSLSLPRHVYRALAAEANEQRQDDKEFMRWLLIEHAMSAGFLKPEETMMLKIYRSLSRRAAEIAQEIVAQDGFSDDITLKTIQRCRQEPDWLQDYRSFVGGDEFVERNPRKGSLNQNIGYHVKRAVGADVDTGPNGNKVVVKVTGEIIKSYTRLKMPK